MKTQTQYPKVGEFWKYESALNSDYYVILTIAPNDGSMPHAYPYIVDLYSMNDSEYHYGYLWPNYGGWEKV